MSPIWGQDGEYSKHSDGGSCALFAPGTRRGLIDRRLREISSPSWHVKWLPEFVAKHAIAFLRHERAANIGYWCEMPLIQPVAEALYLADDKSVSKLGDEVVDLPRRLLAPQIAAELKYAARRGVITNRYSSDCGWNG